MYNIDVFYRPGSPGQPPRILDVVDTHSDGRQFGRFSGESLESCRQRYGAEVATGDFQVVDAQITRFHTLAPQEIEAETYRRALERATVVDRQHSAQGLTWKDAQRIYGCITAVYAQAHGRCYRLQNSIGLTHQAILDLVETHRSQQLVTG